MEELEVVEGTLSEVIEELGTDKDIRFPCCFCGKDMQAPTDEGQVTISFPDPHIRDHLEQTWFCHLECFKQSLHEEFRVFRTEWFEFLDQRDEGADLR